MHLSKLHTYVYGENGVVENLVFCFHLSPCWTVYVLTVSLMIVLLWKQVHEQYTVSYNFV